MLDRVQIERLEGMANHQRRALAEVADNLLLYAPATRREQFVHAVGYLIRRLDENTGPDNFLSYAFRLEVDNPDWHRLSEQFVDSFALIEDLQETPRRIQDRRQPPSSQAKQDLSLDGFANEPDTDFSLPQNIDWAKGIIERWKPRHGDEAADIPLVIAGREVRQGRELKECHDPSLLILEDEVYEDPAFKAALRDAIKSLPIGSAWDRKTRVAPLIRSPGPELKRGLKELEPGERWALMPKRFDRNPQLWSPGLKWDVSPGSFTQATRPSRTRVTVPGLAWLLQEGAEWSDVLETAEEDDEELARVIQAGGTERVRYAGPDGIPLEIFSAANEVGIFIARAPVLAEGRVELLWYVREQSVSHDYHRYGNLGVRAEEVRAPVL